MANKVYGYARVSTQDQVLDRQVDILQKEHGIDPADIFVEKITDAKFSRPMLDQLQLCLREGDLVVVESLSRLSRSAQDLLRLLKAWETRGITFISFKERIDFSTTTGKLVLAVLSALSEFERDTLRDRVREGLASARSRGRVGGRPKKDRVALEKAVKLHAAKTHTLAEIVSLTKVSTSVLYRELRRLRELEHSSHGSMSES